MLPEDRALPRPPGGSPSLTELSVQPLGDLAALHAGWAPRGPQMGFLWGGRILSQPSGLERPPLPRTLDTGSPWTLTQPAPTAAARLATPRGPEMPAPPKVAPLPPTPPLALTGAGSSENQATLTQGSRDPADPGEALVSSSCLSGAPAVHSPGWAGGGLEEVGEGGGRAASLQPAPGSPSAR